MLDARRSEAVANPTTMEVEGDRDVVISRVFRAPPRIVFEAYTKPELVRRWWAPRSMGVELGEVSAEVRVGGRYRYVTRTPEGDMAFSGTYTEVSPPSRLVYTQVFEPMADAGHAVVTVTFTEQAGQTRMVSHERYPSKEARDAALASGMEEGMRETMDQLDALVASLHAGGRA